MKKIFLFMDEKGTQNSFNISVPFSYNNKIKYGDDRMTSYVGNILAIPENKIQIIEMEYKKIVSKLLKSNHQLKNNREIKGSDILKKFDNGIASLKDSSVEFYTEIFKMLNSHNIKNILFMVNKISCVVSSRIDDFIYHCDEKIGFPAFTLKYCITKFISNDASEKMHKILFDLKKNEKDVLLTLIEEIKYFSEKNQHIPRLQEEIVALNAIHNLIAETLKDYVCKTFDENKKIAFNWNLVDWALDLWISENDSSEYYLFLDNGIPRDVFQNNQIIKIYENINSKDNIGIQISDNIVSLVGKTLSKLNIDLMHNENEIDKVKNIRKDFFKLSEKQFLLIKEMGNFLLFKNTKFHYVIDTFFDDSAVFWSFIETVCDYDDFVLFNKKHEENVDIFFLKYRNFMQQKFLEVENWKKIKELSKKTLKELVEEKIAKPI